jgi:hypothetical protein
MTPIEKVHHKYEFFIANVVCLVGGDHVPEDIALVGPHKVDVVKVAGSRWMRDTRDRLLWRS